MSEVEYGLCDTDSSHEEEAPVGGVSTDRVVGGPTGVCVRNFRLRNLDRIRSINAKNNRLRRAKESAEERRLRLEAQRVRGRRLRAMRRRMAESGEDPLLWFDFVEDNREVPVRFDGVEVDAGSGGIKERPEMAPGEATRRFNREFVARVRANMTEEESLQNNEDARVGMESFRDRLSESDRAEVRAQNTEYQRAKRHRSRNEETKRYEMRFDTTEEEYLGIMNEENVDYDVVFRDSAKNLAKGVMLYYANSGCGENSQYREYDKHWEGKPIDQDDICRQVELHKSSCEDNFRMIGGFFADHSYTNASLLSCGACGYRIRERLTGKRAVKYTRYGLGSDELEPLRYNEEQIKAMREMQGYYRSNPVRVPCWNEERNSSDLRIIEPWKVMSVYESSKYGLFHLHPELVDVDDSGVESVLLCTYCSDSVKNIDADRKKRVPRFSIANGIDFGYYKRVGLMEPNLHEEVILSRVRAVIASYKVKSNMCGVRNVTRDKMQCNAILFCEEQFEKLSDMLSGHDMFDENGLELLLQIFLLDDKGELDRLVHMAHGRYDILARPVVVVEWITVLIHVHVYYKDLQIPSVREIFERIERSNYSILRNAIRVDGVGVNEVERTVGSDNAGVQQVDDGLDSRFASVDLRMEEGEEDDESGGIKVSCAIRPPERCLQEDNVYRFARLRSLRNLIGPGSIAYHKTRVEDGSESSDDEEESDNIPGEEIGIDIDGVRERLGIRVSQSECNPDNGGTYGLRRKADPVNEFLEPDSVVTAAFPTVFMLGSAYKRPMGRLSGHARHHLLHQFTMVPSKCRRFLLYLFDATSRLSSINSVNAYVGKHKKARQVILNLLDNQEARAELEDAYHDPKSELAKAVLKKYVPYLRFSASKVGYGLGVASKLETELNESSKRFQAASGFFTLSFDDPNNPRAIRATFATANNREFPAVFEQGCIYGGNGTEFMENIRKCLGDPMDIGNIGLSESVRARLSMEDPVTFVSETKEMLVSVCELLLGVQLEHMFTKISGETSQKTRYFKSSKGIFGCPMALIGVIEDHARGTVHFHLLFFGGLTPYLLQRFSSLGPVCEKISEVLDTMYCCSLPGDVQLGHVFRRVVEKERKIGRFLVRVPQFRHAAILERSSYASIVDVERNAISFDTVLRSVATQGSYQQNHFHLNSCTNSKAGNDGCRYGAFWSLIHRTWPRMLVRLTKQELDTIDDLGCIPCSPVVLDIDRVEDLPRENSEEAISDIDSDAAFSEEQGTTDGVEQGDEGQNYEDSASGADSNVPMEVFEDDLYRDGIPSGMSRAYVCARDPITLKPALAFKVVDEISTSIYPDTYRWCDPLKVEKDRPLVIWEIRRPWIDYSLPDITGVSDCTSLLIIQTLFDILKVTKEFEDWESDFWEDMKMIPLDCLIHLYDNFCDAIKKANGYVSTFNPVLSFCTGSHNNVSLLGSNQQAKCAMYYISPYLGKNKEVLLHSLGILRGAVNHAEMYKSAAPDAEIDCKGKMKKNPKRLVKRILQRFVNQANLHVEMSDYQIAAMLLDIPCIITTEQYVYVDPRAQMAYRTFFRMDADRLKLQDDLIDRITNEADRRLAESVEEDGFIASESDCSSDEEEEIDPNTELPVYDLEDIQRGIGYLMPLSFKNGKKDQDPVRMLIPKVALYANRGYDLRELNLIEYFALIDKRPRTTTKNTQSKHFEFPLSFVCASEYDQVLCMKQKTVIVVGKAPPYPGNRPRQIRGAQYDKWRREADEYARFYLTLFRPEVLCYDIVHENTYKYDWESLEAFVNALSTDKSILSKFRLMSMHTRMKGLYTPYDNKVFSGTYRNRSRDMWDPHTKRLVALDKKLNSKSLKNKCKYYERVEDEYARLSVNENNNMSKILSDSMDLVNSIASIGVSTSRRSHIPYGKSGYIPTDPLC